MVNVDTNDLLTVSQAAMERGTTRQAINHLIRQGKIEAVEIAGRRFLSRRALAEFEPDKGGRPSKAQSSAIGQNRAGKKDRKK